MPTAAPHERRARIITALSLGVPYKKIAAAEQVTHQYVQQIATKQRMSRRLEWATVALFIRWCPVCLVMRRVYVPSKHGPSYCVRHGRLRRTISLSLVCTKCDAPFVLTGLQRNRHIQNRRKKPLSGQWCPQCNDAIPSKATNRLAVICAVCGMARELTGKKATARRYKLRHAPDTASICSPACQNVFLRRRKGATNARKAIESAGT